MIQWYSVKNGHDAHVSVGVLRQVGRLCVSGGGGRGVGGGRRVELIRCCASSLLGFLLPLSRIAGSWTPETCLLRST